METEFFTAVIINLHGVSTELKYSIVFAMQTCRELKFDILHWLKNRICPKFVVQICCKYEVCRALVQKCKYQICTNMSKFGICTFAWDAKLCEFHISNGFGQRKLWQIRCFVLCVNFYPPILWLLLYDLHNCDQRTL